MTEPNDAVPAVDDGEPAEPLPDTAPPAEPVPEAQRETEQTIRSISRLEERN
jgi:hypothetical protein